MNKINKFIDEIGREEMDSFGAMPLIDFAINFIPSDVEKILCIGSGSGYELKKLREKYDVLGIDYNSINTKCGAIQMDMHDLKFTDKEFDLVFCRDVFEHSIAPLVAFSEMCRVSKKYVYIVLPDDTWALSLGHTMIPTLKQMICWGIKMDFSLDYYTEQFHSSGEMFFKEYYYIFRRK